MNVNLINPFIQAIFEVMPQFGFDNIKRGNLKLSERMITCKGFTVIVGLTKQLTGNIAYNMTAETAKRFASTMMMGASVDQLDGLAQSAVAELVNMMTANAAIQLERDGVLIDISSPNVFACHETTKFCNSKYMSIELFVGSELVEVNIGLEGVPH